MIYKAKDLILYCEKNNMTIADIVLNDEMENSGRTV